VVLGLSLQLIPESSFDECHPCLQLFACMWSFHLVFPHHLSENQPQVMTEGVWVWVLCRAAGLLHGWATGHLI